MRAATLLILLAGCGIDSSSSHVAPANPPAPPAPRCALMMGGGYYDDKLGTPCTFGSLDGVRVCLPNDMPKVISGMCDPKGGPDRIWIDRAGGCGGNGASHYALSTNTKSCGDLKGPIEVVADTVQPDQTIYTYDVGTKACTPSGLTALPNSPIVDRAPSPPNPFYLYAADLPAKVCTAQ